MIAYITELTDDNFTEFTKEGVVLIDIFAPWCGPCKVIGPFVDELSVEYKGQVSVGKLNADNNGGTTTDLGIRSIPTLLIYKDGELIDRIVGSTTKQKIAELIDKNL